MVDSGVYCGCLMLVFSCEMLRMLLSNDFMVLVDVLMCCIRFFMLRLWVCLLSRLISSVMVCRGWCRLWLVEVRKCVLVVLVCFSVCVLVVSLVMRWVFLKFSLMVCMKLWWKVWL